MKAHAIKLCVLVLCLNLSALAQQAQQTTLPPQTGQSEKMPVYADGDPDGGPTVTLMSGPLTLVLSSYGRSTNFSVAGPDQLFEHQDFIGMGGAIITVGPPACTIVSPITTDGPTRASSAVRCGGCLLNYSHSVEGSGMSGSWQTVVGFADADSESEEEDGTCNLQCFYPYTDYDVFGDLNDLGTFVPGDNPRFNVRDSDMPNVVFYFQDERPAPDRWEQALWPSLRNRIAGAGSCVMLANSPGMLGPTDWTGAFEVRRGDYACYSHGRD